MTTKVMKEDGTLLEAFATLIGTFVMVILAPLFVTVVFIPFTLYTTLVRLKMWEWFAVPYLHVPAISFWVMFGIGLLVSTFRGFGPAKEDEKFKWASSFKSLLARMVLETIFFGLAFVIHQWLV